MIRRALRSTVAGMAMIAFAVVAHAQTPDLAAMVGQLTPLPRTAGKVSIPLDGKQPWRGVHAGVDIGVRNGRLVVAYVIAPGRPAGAALVFGKGSLRELRVLRIRATADRAMQILPTLQDADGAAFAFPPLALTKDKTVEVELRVDELTYFAPQSKVDEPDRFATADAVMLTLLDTSGFTGGHGAASFTIESIEGEL